MERLLLVFNPPENQYIINFVNILLKLKEIYLRELVE